MRVEVFARLRCPVCRSGALAWREFLREGGELLEGVAWCEECRAWFPVEDGFLDLLTGPLAYVDERDAFWKTREAELTEAIISADRLRSWLEPSGFRFSSRTSVFLPPHVVNWTTEERGFRILDSLDRAMSHVPWLRANGGLVIFEARR